ncbi:MAG: hypothetical protein AAFX78_02670 [Cyanobacteria bacterium J06638_20]
MTDKTIVIFRADEDGDAIAFFPELPWNLAGDMTCYQHIGQHGSASLEYYRERTFPLRLIEKKVQLRAELESLGYVLEERNRLSPKMNETRWREVAA